MRLTLDGRVLTAEIVKTPRVHRTPTTEQRLYGKRIDAVCSPHFLHPRRGAVVRTRRWPVGARRMSFRFGHDISGAAKWCLIEDGGLDVAVVSFIEREPIRFVGKGRGPSGAWWRLGGGRGLLAEPCALLRTERVSAPWCFSEFADRRVTLGVQQWPACVGDGYAVGVVSLDAAAVHLRLSDGTTVDAKLFDRPRGSRVQARFFLAALRETASVRSAQAVDSAGTVLATRRTGDESVCGAG
jgi:hypothetical protein